MANQTGQKDQALITGRIMYGYDGTNAYPIAVNTAGVLSGIATTISKTIQTELFAAASVAVSTVVLSSTLDVSSVKNATIFIDHGKASTAGFTTNGTEYMIQVSQQSANNDTWRTLASVLASSAVAASAAASSDCAAGTTLVKITSGTAMPANDNIVFTSGTIEWVRSTIATGTASFNIMDATRYGHASATGLFAGAEHFAISLNLEAATRLRVVINNQASAGTQPIVVRVAAITET